MKRKSVLVYGFARSGTSMTCGVLNCLGFQIITEEANERQLRHNPKGLFESGKIIEIGHVINRNSSLGEQDFSQISQELKDIIDANLIPYIPDSGNWGIKTPTLNAVDILLQHMHNPYILCIHRNMIDQAKSYQMWVYKREKTNLDLCDTITKLSKNYMHMANEIERLSKNYPVSFTTYEGLKSNPWEEAKKIADFLEVTPTEEMRKNVLEFVDKDLHTWKDEGSKTIPIEIDLSKYSS